jgi:hypothetical protein
MKLKFHLRVKAVKACQRYLDGWFETDALRRSDSLSNFLRSLE